MRWQLISVVVGVALALCGCRSQPKSPRPPPLPITKQQIKEHGHLLQTSMMQAPEVVRELAHHDFDIIDQRLTNGLGSLLFSWELNATNLAGFYLYYGNSNGFIGRLTMPKDARSYRMDNVPRTPQNHFGLSAFGTAGIEGPLATNRIVWPTGQAPAYSNFVVSVPYGISTNANGPWLNYTARLHYVSQPVGTKLFWRGLPLQIEGAP